MVSLIICHVIMWIKFISMKSKNIRLKTTLQGSAEEYHSLMVSISEKKNARENRWRKRWLTLPYPLRLWIEHKVYVSIVIVNNSSRIMPSVSKMLLLPVARRLSRLQPVLKKLNNPYKPFTNAPVSDVQAAVRIQKFLERVNSSNNPFSVLTNEK